MATDYFVILVHLFDLSTAAFIVAKRPSINPFFKKPTNMNQSGLIGFVACLGLAVCAGCSNFPQQFAEMSAQPRAANSVAGPWVGEWISDGGHRGGLKCLLTETPHSSETELPTGPVIGNSYEARFEARFFGIFTAHYAAMLRVNPSKDDVTHLSGDHDLGGFGGGKYHYEAKVTPEHFDATYRSNADQGVFQMQRPKN